MNSAEQQAVRVKDKDPDPIKELMLVLMQWREKWGIKYRKIEVKIKEEVAFISVTDDYTPRDFELKV